jgi:hypothetical protein
MRVKFIEATQDGERGFNWGKFMLARFDTEWEYRSALPGADDQLLIRGRGWGPDTILFLDLQTGEGTLLTPGGHAGADLQKHRIWVCPIAEPFLTWLYQQDLSDLDALPALVEIPDAEPALVGYRRPGKEER